MIRLASILLFLFPFVLFSQVDEHIRNGNDLYNNGEFTEAEKEYDKALSEDAKSYEGAFNLGDSYFRQEKYEEAAAQFESIADDSKDANTKSWAYHNQGNSLLQNEQLDESIEAYKNALRSNSDNEAARYNMAYAQQLKTQQQEQEQESEDEKDDENEKDKDKKEDRDDEGDKDKKDKEKSDEEKDKDEKNKKEDEKDEQEPQPAQLSKEDAKRLLDAQKNQEQKTQDKLRELKAKKGQKVKIEKDW
jgi:Ca-activated chloride channel homolog